MIGATLPKVTELTFQQKVTPEALILVGKASAVRGFSVHSVIPINIPINKDSNNITVELLATCNENING